MIILYLFRLADVLLQGSGFFEDFSILRAQACHGHKCTQMRYCE
jgi:hypothetical protein